jgi:hypothetical protein
MPRLDITVRPLVDPVHRVHVEVVADGAADDVRTWSLDEGAPAMSELAVRDDDGAIAFERTASGAGVRLVLARAANGAVRVAYDIVAAANGVDEPLLPFVTPQAFRASGEWLLLLPVAYDEKPVATKLHIAADTIGASGAASSFGIGVDREKTVRGRFLRHAAFLAGQLGTAVFHTQEADDEAAWIGLTAFDPRAVASETAIIRSAVETFFGGHEAGPMPLLIMGHVRPPRLFSMSRRSNSTLLNVGMQEPWGPVGRIAVSHQVTQKWIGGAVWVGPDDPAHEAESYWFSEGVARFFARDILFRVGLLEPEEVRDSVAQDLAAWYTSPRRSESNQALAAHVGSEGAMSLLVARGSLYALGANARLRAKSGGKRSLDMVMLALLREARESHRRVLPIGSWLGALARELGDEEQGIFEEAIGKGQRLALPAEALGPCFRRTEGKYARFDLGFDEAATRASPRRIVAGLEHGGPAERAGLKASDVLVLASYDAGSAQAPAQLEIERDGKPLTIRYAPVGETHTGQVWVRRRAVPGERCKP